MVRAEIAKTLPDTLELPLVYEFNAETYSLVKAKYGAFINAKLIPVRTYQELKRLPKEFIALSSPRLLKWLINTTIIPKQLIVLSQSSNLAKEIAVFAPDEVKEQVLVAPNNDMDVVLFAERDDAPKIAFVDPAKLRSFKMATLVTSRYTSPSIIVNWLYNGGQTAKFMPTTIVQSNVNINDEEI